MDEKPNKKSAVADYNWLEERHLAMKNWRAWGSWFSWGSPVGLGLFYALVAISTGITVWLIHHR